MFKKVFDDAKFIFMLSSFVGSKKRSYLFSQISQKVLKNQLGLFCKAFGVMSHKKGRSDFIWFELSYFSLILNPTGTCFTKKIAATS